jgi:outer membrane receptor protein involved in Fe transport
MRPVLFFVSTLLFSSFFLWAEGETAIMPLEVVVSANRASFQDTLDTPQSISVIDHTDLNKKSVYANLEEALHALPNVGLGQSSTGFSFFQGGNSSSNYWQQGFSIRGLGYARVLVLTDGIRQSGQGIGYGGGNMSLYDIPAVERVEVLRGPASVLYGTDAFGGVVHIISQEPKFLPEQGFKFTPRITYDGSRRLWRRSVTLTAGSPNHAVVVGLTDTEAKTPKAPKGTLIDSGAFHGHGFWIKTLHKLSRKSQLKLLANATCVEDVVIANRPVLLTGPKPGIPGTNTTTPLKIDIPHYRRTALGAEWSLQDYSEALEQVKVGLYWQQLARRFLWDAPMAAHRPAPRQTGVSKRLTHDKGNTIELQPMAVVALGDHKLTAGLDLGYDNVKLHSQRTDFNMKDKPILDESMLNAKAKQLRSGVYLQDRWDLFPFEVTLGGRWDAFYVKDQLTDKSSRTSGLSGSLSLLRHFGQKTSAYATVSTGYRAPDLGERFQQTVVVFHSPITVLGNPALRSETAHSLEFGVKHRSERIKGNIAFFASEIQNYIGLQYNKPLKAYQYQNVGDVSLYGGEGDLSWSPIDHLEIFGGVGRTHTNHKNLIALPSWAGHFGASYEIECNRWGMKFMKPMIKGNAFASCTDTLNKTYMLDGSPATAVRYPGFVSWDAQVSFAFKTSNRIEGDLTLGVKNCFNRTYYTPFFGNPHLRMNPQPARGFFMTASLNF